VKYGAYVGWGIVIYAVVFFVWSALNIHGLADGYLARGVSLLALVLTAGIAGRSLKLPTWKDVLPYSVAWVVVIAACDAIVAVPYTGWTLYADWNVWVGYALVLGVPLLTTASNLRSPAHQSA